MEYHIDYLQKLVSQGGPEVEDYDELNAWLLEVSEQHKNGDLTARHIGEMRAALGDATSLATIQGFAYQKPHGYAGDYEIIDKIYSRYVCPQPHLMKWDTFLQSHAATKAVRNRKRYFIDVVKKHVQLKSDGLSVLNIASGPGRDMQEFFLSYPRAHVRFDCVEQDEKAVVYASKLCEENLDNINFIIKNALRFKSKKCYDLIWSAGLFDYFNDKTFIFMLKKLKRLVCRNGEIVIGNFSPNNPTRPYMELFEWHLCHRSPQKLRFLARESGFSEEQIAVNKEPTGVNLFLHINLNAVPYGRS